MTLQDNFRKAMRSYVYSVSVMSNIDAHNNFNAITVSSVTSVSIDPPSLLVCINKTAGIHDSIVKDDTAQKLIPVQLAHMTQAIQIARVEHTGGTWPPQGVEVFNPWHLPLINTIILLTSGTTVTWAHHALKENKRGKEILWLS